MSLRHDMKFLFHFDFYDFVDRYRRSGVKTASIPAIAIACPIPVLAELAGFRP
jgi:hypothetical protein